MARQVLKYRLRRWALALVALAPVAWFIGCGGSKLDTVPISGKVTYQGNPVPWGEVKFRPAHRSVGRAGVAAIRADGSYSVGTLDNAQGLLSGQYRVTVAAAIGPLFAPTEEQKAAAAKIKLPTPARYANPNTSGLTLTVNPGDDPQTYNIDLTE